MDLLLTNLWKSIKSGLTKGKYKFGNNETEEIFAYLRKYKESDTNQREEIRNNFPIEDSLLVLSISDQLVDKAINEKNHHFLEKAIQLHSLEDFRWDPRENIIRLSVIWHVAEKLKINPNELFDNVANISSGKAASQLIEFKNRPKQLKSLKAMGLIEKKENGKISFIPKPPPWMEK